jgi:hypothetical protein
METKQKGWTKTYNAIFSHVIFKNAEHFKLWLWLIGNASFATHVETLGKHKVTIFRGEVYVTCKELSEVMNVYSRSIRRMLIELKDNYEVIGVEKFYQYYKITVKNYDRYQSKKDKN